MASSCEDDPLRDSLAIRAPRGSANGEHPVVRVVELWCAEVSHTLAQAQVDGREDTALLKQMGLEDLAVVGDAGFLYPRPSEQRRGSIC